MCSCFSDDKDSFGSLFFFRVRTSLRKVCACIDRGHGEHMYEDMVNTLASRQHRGLLWVNSPRSGYGGRRPTAVLRIKILTGCLVNNCRRQAFREVILTVISLLKRNPSVTGFYLDLKT